VQQENENREINGIQEVQKGIVRKETALFSQNAVETLSPPQAYTDVFTTSGR
jgi:hypothetical protein